MFGTSGIRGLYGKEVTEELALKVSNIFSTKDIAIARDIRQSGIPLSKAIISGVMSKGKNITDLGVIPTPTLALATRTLNCNGIMVTASHNPPEYNGLKLFSNGLEIPKEQEAKITKEFDSGLISFCNWDETGKIKEYGSAIEDHKNLIKKLINLPLIREKKPKVVLDCNGPASVIAPQLMEELGCKAIPINTSLEKFERPSEPNSKNLSALSKKVIENSADLGIGYDGDADRAVVVDEKGEALALDVQLALMIEYELKQIQKNKKIVTTVEASLTVRNAISQNNAEPVIVPVGSLYVSEQLKKTLAAFGGEPCGEYIFGKGIGVPDGILTGVKFAEMFCKFGNLSKLKEKYKTYPMLREKFKCTNSKKYEIVDKIRSQLKDFEGEKRTDDGIRIDQKDGWFLIRASGTEPFIRLTMEYTKKPKLEKMSDLVRNLITSDIV